jgi:hypothetical protein
MQNIYIRPYWTRPMPIYEIICLKERVLRRRKGAKSKRGIAIRAQETKSASRPTRFVLISPYEKAQIKELRMSKNILPPNIF